MFMCFSSGDRYTVVKSCLYHLKNYGFTVWYDYHELILGDSKREKNFTHAINNNKYFIVIYSKHFFNSPCAIEEEKIIFEQMKKRNIVVFPLLYNIKFSEMPDSYQKKIENLIYNEIDDTTGTINSINQIVSKVLIDKITASTLESTPTINTMCVNAKKDLFLHETIEAYKKVDKKNFNACIAILFCITKYVYSNYKIDKENIYLFKILDYLFNYTSFSVEFNHKEIIIAELALVLILKTIL